MGNYENTVYEIKFDDQNKLFRCSCVHGQKWIDCKHAIVYLIKFAKFVIPETAISVSLQTQRKTQGEQGMVEYGVIIIFGYFVINYVIKLRYKFFQHLVLEMLRLYVIMK